MAHEIVEGKDAVGYTNVALPPWHGLGMVVPGNMNVMEAAKFTGLDWTVSKRALWRVDPTDISRKFIEIDGYMGITREDNGDLLDIVSDKYSVLQNLEAFEILNTLKESSPLLELETLGSLKAGRIVWGLLSINGAEDTVDEAGTDKVKRFVLFSWGHYSGRSAQLGYTDIRAVCWNTLSAAERYGQLIRILHRGDVQKSMDLVAQSLDVATQGFKANVDLYRQMLRTSINQEDLVKYVRVSLQLEDKTSTKANNILAKVVGYAGAGGIGNEAATGTLWGAFNAVTQWVSREQGRTADNRVASSWWGNGKSTINAAFDLAKQVMGVAA